MIWIGCGEQRAEYCRNQDEAKCYENFTITILDKDLNEWIIISDTAHSTERFWLLTITVIVSLFILGLKWWRNNRMHSLRSVYEHLMQWHQQRTKWLSAIEEWMQRIEIEMYFQAKWYSHFETNKTGDNGKKMIKTKCETKPHAARKTVCSVLMLIFRIFHFHNASSIVSLKKFSIFSSSSFSGFRWQFNGKPDSSII